MKIYFFAFLLLLTFSSCEEDLCENIVCNNDGICNEGTCDCPPEFTGTFCNNLAPASAVRITKIIITEWNETDNNSQPWDADSNPDPYVSFQAVNPPQFFETETIENAAFGSELEYVTDWRINKSDTQLGDINVTVSLEDDDGVEPTFESRMGVTILRIQDFRTDKPAFIEVSPSESTSFGLRVELEWIFE